MPEAPTFSVIIPSYRCSATVGDAVRSALLQDGVSLEVIVVVDGSPERDEEAARRTAPHDQRLRIVRIENGGVSAARNHGARLAKGGILAFLDADDMLLPGALKAHLQAFEKDRELMVSFGRVRFWDPEAAGQEGRVSSARRTLPLPLIIGDNHVCTASNIVVRADGFRQIWGFDERLRRAEDQDFLARATVSGFRIRGLDRLTVKYRTSGEGLSSDLGAFEQAWRRMLRNVEAIAPERVARQRGEIDARFTRYQVRRRLRLGTAERGDIRLLMKAFLAAPQLIAKEPRRCLQTLGGAMLARALPCSAVRHLLSR